MGACCPCRSTSAPRMEQREARLNPRQRRPLAGCRLSRTPVTVDPSFLWPWPPSSPTRVGSARLSAGFRYYAAIRLLLSLHRLVLSSSTTTGGNLPLEAKRSLQVRNAELRVNLSPLHAPAGTEIGPRRFLPPRPRGRMPHRRFACAQFHTAPSGFHRTHPRGCAPASGGGFPPFRAPEGLQSARVDHLVTFCSASMLDAQGAPLRGSPRCTAASSVVGSAAGDGLAPIFFVLRPGRAEPVVFRGREGIGHAPIDAGDYPSLRGGTTKNQVAGSVNRISVPLLGSLFAQILPPCCSTMHLAM